MRPRIKLNRTRWVIAAVLLCVTVIVPGFFVCRRQSEERFFRDLYIEGYADSEYRAERIKIYRSEEDGGLYVSFEPYTTRSGEQKWKYTVRVDQTETEDLTPEGFEIYDVEFTEMMAHCGTVSYFFRNTTNQVRVFGRECGVEIRHWGKWYTLAGYGARESSQADKKIQPYEKSGHSVNRSYEILLPAGHYRLAGIPNSEFVITKKQAQIARENYAWEQKYGVS